ncbi:sodium:proton exchanger [Candidatus Uhrbacteria bacterium CG_4_9_14_3_um_filter_50_9]|uniref:Sodium:proton exchanger n=1 Tax=Candidatus Uhrbacteria bacterium CG_4_9_14_3_um_filter_50_9 TaxID=1975035 RepID=A0A2M7XE25_9BACT|nr:MAG: sodium:proton exchanger [Candidatus Uhrbacteria bacterium CG_4_9_14_3_um_filter_50_9]
MLTNAIMVLAGFILLIKGADFFVSGSASLARKLGIPSLVVGLTVISIGTSAPELFVNLIAAVQGSTALSIGNVLGSNFADILLGLGLAALFTPLALQKGTVWKEIPFSLLAGFMILVFGSDLLLDGTLPNIITRSEGIALLALFVVFIVYTFGVKQPGEQPEEHIEVHSSNKTLGLILSGVAGLAIGGFITVEGAVGLAEGFGISQNLIGLTVVAAGTSLPEIITSIQAARKGHIDLVVGGIVGTIIFNALFVLGVTALVRPLPFAADSLTDAFAVMGATFLLFLSLFIGRKNHLGKTEGTIMLLLYFAYIIFAVVRG